MLIVSRNDFIAWVNGVFLDRDRNGRCIAPNEIACKVALEALDKGEKIFLTVNNEVFSTMKKSKGKFVEKMARYSTENN